MAFVAEVKARLGLDTTEFQRALTKTKADLGQLGSETNRKLARSFGGDDAIKGLLTGAGIGSVEQVVAKLTEGFREAAESAKRIAESTAETLGIYEQLFASRRTDQQNLDANLAKQKRLREELKNTSEQSEMRTLYGPGGAYSARFVTRAYNKDRADEITNELAKLSREEFSLRDKIKKTNEENAAIQSSAETEQIAALMKWEEMERENAAKNQTDEQNLAKLIEERASISALASETDYERKQEVARIDGKILDLEKKITQEKQKQAKEQKELAKRLRDAEESLARSQQDEENAFADRSGLSLEQAAAMGVGSLRATARRIQFLEARATRRRATGFEAEAFEDTSRALKLRAGLGALSTSERNPMANAAESIRKSEEHLAEIRENLKPEKIK